ncbi:ComEA family DNA-binding protein [Pseudomonas sp. BNK-43-a]|uniref:ComEA family DNA-binding protein n=1 Tax=unclassified Pseudomonas TaxID=196821 RepID=UPI0039BF01E9
MRNIILPYLFLPAFAVFSFALNAAPIMAVPASPKNGVLEVNLDQVKAGKLNLNLVDATTLQAQLTGIGKAKAEAIVAYRETHGAFSSVDELLEVSGIGSALLERNREKLTVD